MLLLDHISVTVRDLARARPFYDAIFAALGIVKVYDEATAVGYGTRNRASDDGHSYLSVFESPAASPDPRRHCCFRAASAEQVAAFHAAGLRHGGTSDGAPGPRPAYHAGYFAAFIVDPEGNRLEAVFHRAEAAVAR